MKLTTKASIILLAAVSLGFMTASLNADVEPSAAAPDFTLTDTNGKSVKLSDYKGKFVVLEWINFDCPFVIKQYGQGNMQKLQKEYTGKGVVWLSINSSAEGKEGHYDNQQINDLLKQNASGSMAYLQDADGAVGKLYGAKTTPHMYIINPEGKLVYQGAIDSIPSADPADIAKAENYVSKGLDEAMAGQAVSTPTTKSYGCSVKY